MATTPKGIYYPNDYNEIADIPEDMKKMAESIEEVFEDTDSDLSDIKEEQTTQNNRLNSLEVDNTTNKSDILTNKQDINNIKTEQTEQNTNISTNATNIESLQEENESLKKIVSQLPQVEGQGTEVTLENTIEAQFTKFDVEGNSTQIVVPAGVTVSNVTVYPMLVSGTYTRETIPNWEKYTGGIASPNPNYEQPIYSAGDNENIFDKDNEEQFLQNLTPDNNGLIVSAQTSTTSPNYIRTIIIPCKSDANYAITRFLGGKTFFIYESDEYPTLNKQTTLLKRNNDAGKASEIIKTSATAKYLLVKIYNTYASEYYSYDELISIIKIEKSNKASGYSPYGMGSINEKIQNKNWLPNNVVNQTKNGVTLVKNNDGTITANGTATAQTEILISSVKLSAGNYLGSIGVTGSVSTYYVRLGEGTTSQSPFIANIGTGDNAFSLTESKTIGAVLIIRSGQTLNNVIFKPMIRLASITDNSYVPHEEQNYSIFVQQPFRSIGDVRDCFVKKSDGWYERHYIGQVVLDGTEGWMQSSQSNQRFIAGTFNNTLTNSSQVLAMSEKYRGIKFDDLNSDINYTCYSQEGWFGFNTKDIVSLSEWKEELSNDNLSLYYVLATPLDLPCTPEQVEQLENLPSTYKEMTIINSEDETPAYLEVSGIYDLNKLITRTEVLESEV